MGDISRRLGNGNTGTFDSCVVDVGVDGLGSCKYRFSFSACQASIPYERDMNQVYKEPPCTCKSQAS